MAPPAGGGEIDEAAEAEARREWAVPSVQGEFEGIDLSLLDASDPDERAMLIRAEHPELAAAIDRGAETVEMGGTAVNPRMHFTIHEIVATQICDGDPPETWETAKRLTALGYERHEVFHMLGSAVAEQIWQMLHEQTEYDHDAFVAALSQLPGSWEAKRREGG